MYTEVAIPHQLFAERRTKHWMRQQNRKQQLTSSEQDSAHGVPRGSPIIAKHERLMKADLTE
jgi:hypothetical protein